MASGGGKGAISGVAVLLATAGVWLVYAGVRDVPVIDGLRDALRGDLPPGSAKPLGGMRGPSGSKQIGGVASDKPTGNITASIPGGIKVDSSIAAGVGALVAGSGGKLGGSGWRSTSQQVALRMKNGCPDVWKAPASACRVPTAIPGQSMHEKGLAVDFTWNGGSITRNSEGFRYLSANAGKYGLKNLPSEPWHWSVNGK